MAVVKKSGGKGLGWNNEELLALAQAAPTVCEDPAVGTGMTRKKLGEGLRNIFIKSTLRPSDACSASNSKDHRDERRWEGRTVEACYRKWISMRADCTSLFAIVKRINALQLTGNFSKDDVFRMALVEFSEGKKVKGHLYDIGNNPDYRFNNKFEYSAAYEFLVGRTSLVSGSAMEDNDVEGDHMVRPIGTKEAKRRKAEQLEKKKADGVEEKTVQRSAHDISVSLAKTQELLEERHKNKMNIAKEQLAFEREKYWMSQAMNLFREGSNADEEERKLATQLMRKRTLASLAGMFAQSSPHDTHFMTALPKPH